MTETRRVRLVLGLGNPGSEYARTRHNAGFLVADRLAGGAHWTPFPEWLEAALRMEAGPLILAVPTTFMNRSGRAAEGLMRRHGLEPGEILVLTDDVFLPMGKLRIRLAGGTGGHKGLLSIQEALGTDQFPRLRLGVGPAEPGTDLADFVLAPLEGEDWARLEAMAERAARAVESICREGLERAMSRFNPGPEAAERQDPDPGNARAEPPGRPA